MPLFKKSTKPLASPTLGDEETTTGTQDQPRVRRASIDTASPHGTDIDIPLPKFKKDRRPSLLPLPWKSGANAESPAPRSPVVIAKCIEQLRSEATAFSESLERRSINSSRISSTSDLPPSPTTSLDLNPPRDEQEGPIPVSFKFRDSGLGQDMGESDLRMKELYDIVQVYKENIDDHVNKLIEHLLQRKNELKRELDTYLIKACQDISDGKSNSQKVEFHRQHDLEIGVITFTDEPDEKRADQANSPPRPHHIAASYINVPNPDRSSSASDDSQDYENVFEDDSKLAQALPGSCFLPHHCEPSSSYMKMSAAAPPKMQKQHSISGYINMNTKSYKRPMPPPKPNFRKS